MSKPAASSPAPAPVPFADIASLAFEKALAELDDIVRRLERGDVPLEDSIRIYERGEALKRHCESLLQVAQQRIDKIMSHADGSVTTAPLDETVDS
jgi:exodeoxyribonuclease VII small subunit